jgi:hypothetical protein
MKNQEIIVSQIVSYETDDKSGIGFVVKESQNKTHWGIIDRIGGDVYWVKKEIVKVVD